jgi:hypothetical protein
MTWKRHRICTLLLVGLAVSVVPLSGLNGSKQEWLVAAAAAQELESVPVTVESFIRAETDTYFEKRADLGPLGQIGHRRTPTPIDQQGVIRMNRDTLYSGAVFDLTAPATITLLDVGNRYRSMHVVNQDHHTKVVSHEPGQYTLNQQAVGTRYAYVIIRTFFDPTDPQDLKSAQKAQDAIRVEQASPGTFKVPRWDQKSLTRVRDALLALAALSDPNAVFDSSFGDQGEVNPIRHLIATAAGWGGLPRTAAMYSSVTPERNDGTVPYTLGLKDVPADAFWSVSVYNEKGFFEKNSWDAYSVNSHSAKRNADGSVTVHFGGDAGRPNHLPIMKGWNYTVRLYRPRKEALEGSWRLPAPQPLVDGTGWK